MKKLSNNEAELKKSVAYKKKRVCTKTYAERSINGAYSKQKSL